LDNRDGKAENGVFDNQKSCRSSGVFDTKRHNNVKSKPGYRRIKKYYKSAGRWRLERERRNQVMQLRDKGLSYVEIAERLGVSERTVKRDMAKIKPYYERQVKSYLRKLQQARIAEVEEELEGKSLSEKLDILLRKWDEHVKLLKRREYLRRQITITIDLDAATAGGEALKCTPKPPLSIKYPFHIKLEIVMKGKKALVGGLTISSSPKRSTGFFGY
jgi:transposase